MAFIRGKFQHNQNQLEIEGGRHWMRDVWLRTSIEFNWQAQNHAKTIQFKMLQTLTLTHRKLFQTKSNPRRYKLKAILVLRFFYFLQANSNIHIRSTCYCTAVQKRNKFVFLSVSWIYLWQVTYRVFIYFVESSSVSDSDWCNWNLSAYWHTPKGKKKCRAKKMRKVF